MLERAGGTATIRLPRPALDAELAGDLREAVTAVAEDASVRAVLLLGTGPRFTVGGDIELMTATAPDRLPVLMRRLLDDYHLALRRLAELDVPVVAGVRGAAAGGGLGLMCVADAVVAAADAVFAVGHCALGLTPDGGATWFLPRLLGTRRAQELVLLGRTLTAAEALEWGLVTRLVPAADVDAEATALATRLAAGPTRALGGARRLLWQSLHTDLGAQLLAEQAAIIEAGATRDAQEGIAAFRGDHPPSFEGR